MSQHTLSVLVEDKPGVLTRVSGLFSRRLFNILSLAVGPTENPGVSRITVVTEGDAHTIEQITKQLHKLVSTYKISDMTGEDTIERELALFKVAAGPERRHEVIEIANVFRAKVVDVGKNSLTIELRATPTNWAPWRTSSAPTASSSSPAPAKWPCPAVHAIKSSAVLTNGGPPDAAAR